MIGVILSYFIVIIGQQVLFREGAYRHLLRPYEGSM